MGTKTCPTPPHSEAKESTYHPLAESFWAQYFA